MSGCIARGCGGAWETGVPQTVEGGTRNFTRSCKAKVIHITDCPRSGRCAFVLIRRRFQAARPKLQPGSGSGRLARLRAIVPAIQRWQQVASEYLDGAQIAPRLTEVDFVVAMLPGARQKVIGIHLPFSCGLHGVAEV